jgi:hypothetical protein
MSDIVNTPRGPKFYAKGTIKGLTFILPIRETDTVQTPFLMPLLMPTTKREYYSLGLDGEWHYDRTETPAPVVYPCFREPEWELPEGV